MIPSYVAVRSRTALLVRNDLDRRWGHHRYAYELYDYTGHFAGRPWERTNLFDDPAHAAERATLMAKLDAVGRLRGRAPRPAGDRRLPVADAGVTVGADAPGPAASVG